MFTFFVVGDPQYNTGAVNANDATDTTRVQENNATILQIKDRITRLGSSAKFLMVVGDLIQHGDTGGKWPFEDCKEYKKHWTSDNLGVDVVEALGNHDQRYQQPGEGDFFAVGDFLKEKNRNRMGRNGQGREVKLTALSDNEIHCAWEIEGVMFINLNEHCGRFSTTSPRPLYHHNSHVFLEEVLRNHVAPEQPIVIFQHLGFDPFSTTGNGDPSLRWGEEERTAFLNSIRGYNVMAVFSGHCHQYQVINSFRDDNGTLVTLPFTNFTTDASFNDNGQQGFLEVSMDVVNHSQEMSVTRHFLRAAAAPRRNWQTEGSNLEIKFTPFSNRAGWTKPSKYSTIQAAGFNDNLYLVARGARGIQTHRLDNNGWTRVDSNTSWANNAGGSDASQYSTIQTVATDNALYLVGRAQDGIHTFKMVNHRWQPVNNNQPAPAWSNDGGWTNQSYYSTIQAVGFNDNLYLIARGARGIQTHRLDNNGWTRVDSNTSWSNNAGGSDASQYSTIQTAATDNALYLVGRAQDGIHTFKMVNHRWQPVNNNQPDPGWSNDGGWTNQSYYSTIQAVGFNDNLYLIARGARGIQTHRLDNNGWTRVDSNTSWSNNAGGSDASQYSTIQTAATDNALYLVGRAQDGIHTFKMVNHRWQPVNNNQPAPAWSNDGGWTNQSYYSTIQAVGFNDNLYLIARGARGILTLRLTNQGWQ